ncbi:MAG TPA: alpha/beta hydrolase [Anaerolineales bacterium]
MSTVTVTKTAHPAPQATRPIPSLDFGGTGEPLHFLHANGYPPGCYHPLIERLATRFRVFGMLLRPLWPGADPTALRDWKPLSEDLRQFLRGNQTGAVVGMGHSIGAVVTLRAALREPELFKALVLIEPVLLSPQHILILRAARALGLAARLDNRINGALRRRRTFDSLEQLFGGYRRREIFRFLSDAQLRSLVEGITRPMPDGRYELTYSPEWEARIYRTGIWNDWDLWGGLRGLRIPTLILRGAETDTFFARTAEMVQKRNPAIRMETLSGATHLAPMEKPEQVFVATREFVAAADHLSPRATG